MSYRIISVALLLWVAAFAPAVSAAEPTEPKTITAEGITVTYPPAMETQAKRILELVRTKLGPALDVQRRQIALLSDPGKLAADIASLLGSEEIQDKSRIRLLAFRDKAEALARCFSNIHLVDKAEAVAKGGVDAGVLQFRYAADTDEFNMGIDLEGDVAGKIKRSYFPVFVNADGSIKSEDKLAETGVNLLGSSAALIIAPVHDTVAYMVAEQFKLYYPFARWFNEGVSGWVTRRVVAKADPKLSQIANEVFSVNTESKKLRNRVSFLSWAQPAFQNRGDPGFDPAIETAHTQYAIEAVSNLLGGNRGDMLAKIVGEVKYTGTADSDAICAAIKKVAGVDFKKTLMTYVPPDIKFGIEAGEAKKLNARAEKLVGEKKWAQAAENLRKALLMNPEDVNARLNLAWIERETGNRVDSERQVFIAARLLKRQEYSFHLFASSIEGNYVLGRLAILVGNLETAKRFLEPVLEAKPDHKDARRAMDEIRTIENAAKSGGG